MFFLRTIIFASLAYLAGAISPWFPDYANLLHLAVGGVAGAIIARIEE